MKKSRSNTKEKGGKVVKTSKSLATKWRPKTLDEVIGQEAPKKILKTIFKSKEIPAGILITGETGCGKTTLSRIIAKTLNCATRDACGKCESCLMMDRDGAKNHPDFKNVNAGPDGGIDDIRELIELSMYAPLYGARILFLDEIHNLTPKAVQALLVPLEEPSEQTCWILATTNPEKLPKALLGRCVHLQLQPVETEVLSDRLKYISKKEGVKLGNKAATKIAEYSGGLVREAIANLESVIKVARANPKADLTKAIDDAFYDDASMEGTMAGVYVLISLYEGNHAQALEYIAKFKDFTSIAIKMSMMNGYVMYSILAKAKKGVKGPYWPTPENRLIWDTIRPDLKTSEEYTRTLRKAMVLAGRLQNLKLQLTSAGVNDPTSIVIANLIAPDLERVKS